MNPFDAPPAILRIENWLGPHLVRQFLDYAQERKIAFEPTGLGRAGHRAGGLVFDRRLRVSEKMRPVPEIAVEIEPRVRAIIQQIFHALGTEPFEPSRFEVELVAHGDGAFYKMHKDETSRTSGRTISAVYYFYRTPKAFTGGELRLHSLRASREPGHFVDVLPENDSIVFFPS